MNILLQKKKEKRSLDYRNIRSLIKVSSTKAPLDVIKLLVVDTEAPQEIIRVTFYKQ
jgi:hypothetical protein